MTRIDFYLLTSPGRDGALPAAVRLCDKARSSGKAVYVHCADLAQLNALDDLLWTQRQGSFIAHERNEGRGLSAPLPQVLIGFDHQPPDGWQDVLINLDVAVPPFFSSFERLCELVGSDENSRAQCRLRYKFYRDRGYELKTLEQTPEGGWQAKT